ncbi:lipase, partial [Bacillus thuringiensis]|uniref:lipase-like domain-containing protein n=1 Tax=Bacillus thuringiensis TaxID=1428 RepID=UPI003D6D0E5E
MLTLNHTPFHNLHHTFFTNFYKPLQTQYPPIPLQFFNQYQPPKNHLLPSFYHFKHFYINKSQPNEVFTTLSLYYPTLHYPQPHPNKHNHKPYPNTYSPFISNSNQTNNLHLLPHTIPPQTIPTLLQFLKHPHPQHQPYPKKPHHTHLSPLFQPQKSYLH